MSAFDSTNKIVSGQYISPTTVSDLTTGAFAVARVGVRGGLMVVPDQLQAYATSGNVDNLFDIRVSSTALNSGYATATTAFFDGSDAGFGATGRYIKIPMVDWRQISLSVYHTLGVNATVDLYTSLISGNAPSLQHIQKIDSIVVATGTSVNWGPYAGGSGAAATYLQCEALRNPAAAVTVAITPASDPSTGEVRIYTLRIS